MLTAPHQRYTVTVYDLNGEVKSAISVRKGRSLRTALLEAGISPYTQLTRRLNCGGRGLCATCGVWMVESSPTPVHWHDQLADRFGYPRLSCQVIVEADLKIQLVDKWIWGGRRSAAESLKKS